MKTAPSLTLIAVGGIIAFAITAHLAFLNLQVTGWVLILTGITGGIMTRNSWLRRILAASRPGTSTAGGTRQQPPRPAPGSQPTAAPDATPAEHETIKEYA